jgi:hypothetical protein
MILKMELSTFLKILGVAWVMALLQVPDVISDLFEVQFVFFAAVLVFLMADTITGVWRAILKKEFTARKGARFVYKTIIYIAAILLAAVAHNAMQGHGFTEEITDTFQDFLVLGLIGIEGYSFARNVSQIAGLPSFLSVVKYAFLKVFNSKDFETFKKEQLGDSDS